MRIIGSGLILLAVLAMTSAASANVVVNGDFSGTYSNVGGYNCPTGWNWFQQDISSTAVNGRLYIGTDLGPGGAGDTCWRIRVVSNTAAKTVMYQVIPTTPGETYTFSAQWRATTAKTTDVNQNLAWSGAFFFNGGSPTDAAANKALIDAFVPDVTGVDTDLHRYSNGGYDPPELSPPTTPILSLGQEIVAEHAEQYGLVKGEATAFNSWETIFDGAGGAGDATMPGIGELAGSGGGAAWQTRQATGDYMIIGFFTLDNPSTNGGGSDLYVDNVAVELVPEPAALVLLGAGMLVTLRRRR